LTSKLPEQQWRNYDPLRMPAWAIWAIVAAVLGVGELLTPGLFVLGLIALGAIVAAVVAAAGAGAVVQVIVFIATSVATLGLLRPVARRHLHMPTAIRTGTAALEGARCLVLQRVDEHGGRVKIAGEEWSARAYMPDQVLEPGTSCEVAKIEGATALVYE
jgi:membrane protein implicated in regulation of membrane protease activity